MSGFWNWWIILLVTANIVFAVWLLLTTIGAKPGDQKAGPETTGHTWDGDLQEYNNPLPRWWLGLFYFTVAFAVAYLVLFPGFGDFRGTLGWSQVGQWQAQTAEANAVAARELGRFAGKSVEELARDPAAIKVAKNLFAANCSMCHGSDARGAKGFPNLTSPNLSWGRDAEAIVATIGGGRQGVMPAWGAVLGADGVEAVANYVVSLSGRAAPEPALVAAGKEKFDTVCLACHGPDGKGNPALGAPNLTDEYWIYGGSLPAIKETITNGRSNKMPAHLELLGEQKVKLLAGYVYSLSPAPTAPAGGAAPAPASGAGG
ncbi:MAG TPA: cytochrome-c oxidase, cbb3-type subunit III [Steroidobacteraceae bacterium]|nr:cytochrome-c oxidase, cbb3-type subunit III [Steroidobacteraceae bacterium]